jgi:hypothetical protein
MIFTLSIDDTSLSWSTEDSLIIQDEDMWIGEEGSLPGGSFPQERDITFQLIGEKRYLSRILHAKGSLRCSYNNKETLVSSGVITNVSLSSEGIISGRVLSSSQVQILNPDPQRIIDFEAFPRADRVWIGTSLLGSIGDAALGKFAPIVLGRPGSTTAGIVKGFNFDDSVPGSPAYLVESNGNFNVADQTWLIAGHPVLSSRCVIFNNNKADSDDAGRLLADRIVCNVSQYEDDRGFTFAGATINNTFSSILVGTLDDFMSKGDTFWVKWINELGEPVDGGLANPYGPGVLTSAGDVIRWCAESSGIKWKADKKDALELYNNLLIDTYINEPTELWSWAMQNIMPLIPAISAISPDGVYLAPFNRALRREDIVLEIGNEASYGETIFTKAEDLPTAITLLYAPSENIDSGFAKQLTIDETISTAFLTAKGLSGSKPIYFEAPVVYDDATAADTLAWLVEYYATTWAYTSIKVLYPDRDISIGSLVWLEAFEKVAMVYSWKIFADGTLEMEVIFKA